MKKAWSFVIGIIFILFLPACAPLPPTPTPTPTIAPTFTPSPPSTPVANAANPCFGAAVPPQWKHIVVLMFENRTYNEVIGPAPYITSLANKCATLPDWKDEIGRAHV